MSTAVMLDLPEVLYQRLASAAKATQRPLAEILLQALRVGSPPDWEDAPAEMQAESSALDWLDDDSLYRITRERWSQSDVDRYDALLDKKEEGSLSGGEQAESSRGFATPTTACSCEKPTPPPFSSGAAARCLLLSSARFQAAARISA